MFTNSKHQQKRILWRIPFDNQRLKISPNEIQ